MGTSYSIRHAQAFGVADYDRAFAWWVAGGHDHEQRESSVEFQRGVVATRCIDLRIVTSCSAHFRIASSSLLSQLDPRMLVTPYEVQDGVGVIAGLT